MKKILIISGAAVAALALYVMNRSDSNSNSDSEEGIMDATQTALDEAIGAVSSAGPVSGMQTSDAMLNQLKRKEKLMLTKYKLNDGGNGWSIGYGHKFQRGETVLDSITRDEAESMFADDVANRAEKWVKLYVTVDLTQSQFDALVSIAYNMSPQSFKKFANAVNAGEGIDGIATASIEWVVPEYRHGIENRRNDEMTLYNQGIYA